jgi:site-specific DNA-methyltransferase (cytosine-N4-specific)
MSRYGILFEYRRTPLRGYERELGQLEVQALTGDARRTGDVLYSETARPIPVSRLRSVTFFERVTIIRDGQREELIPDQVLLEKSARAVRASTTVETQALLDRVEEIPNAGREHTYLSHAWHQYKGKFYPQLVRSAFVIAGLQEGSRVLDPFVGSGTTLVETYLGNHQGFGIDRNPLAAYLSEAKVECLKLLPGDAEREIEGFLDRLLTRTADAGLADVLLGAMEYRVSPRRKSVDHNAIPNVGYLSRWFDAEAIDKLAILVDEIRRVPDRRLSMLMWLTISNLLRDFSQQDPQQLRVQRRKDKAATDRLLYRFVVDLRRHARAIWAMAKLRERLSVKDVPQRAECGDARRLCAVSIPQLKGVGQVDLVVTSPPYATALPYIDTDRLSLFLLGLLKPHDRASLESDMIGNREIRDSDRRFLENQLDEDLSRGSNLPKSVLCLVGRIRDLNQSALVGFRRRNLAALLFKYFRDMGQCFAEIRRVLKPGGLCVVIIGNNHTVAGGELVDIPTDSLLIDLAETRGLRLWKALDMTDQPAYLPHSQNGIRSETILFLHAATS